MTDKLPHGLEPLPEEGNVSQWSWQLAYAYSAALEECLKDRKLTVSEALNQTRAKSREAIREGVRESYWQREAGKAIS